MFSFAFASVLIAFVVTAGAIPLCRSFMERCASRGSAEEAVPPVPKVAGAGMLFSVFIALFYLDSSPGSATELLVAGVFLVLVGSWLGRPGAEHSIQGGAFGYELAASAIVGLGLMLAMPLVPVPWSLGSIVLLGMAMMTPAAISFLSRSPLATPALPAGIALIQLLLLALLGALGAHDMDELAQYKDFRIVALPTIGALIGALIYLCRMPWRAEAEVFTGVVTRLCLGLVVIWGAVGLGVGPGADNERTAALAWILAAPVFELLRRFAVAALMGLLPDDGVARDGYALATAGHSPTSIGIFALMLGGTGIVLWHLQVPAFWSALALVPAFMVYLIAPLLLPSWASSHPSSMVDAQS